MKRFLSRALLVGLLLLESTLIATCFDHLRVGAFNIRGFGRKKVSDDDVLNILIQVVSFSRCRN